MLDHTFETKETPQGEANNLDEFYDAVAVICKFCDYRFDCYHDCPLDPIIKVVRGEENESEED